MINVYQLFAILTLVHLLTGAVIISDQPSFDNDNNALTSRLNEMGRRNSEYEKDMDEMSYLSDENNYDKTFGSSYSGTEAIYNILSSTSFSGFHVYGSSKNVFVRILSIPLMIINIAWSACFIVLVYLLLKGRTGG